VFRLRLIPDRKNDPSLRTVVGMIMLVSQMRRGCGEASILMRRTK
jgi:hypothetical protein